MSADEKGRELESKQPKGVGVYYTPKELLPDLEIKTETGGFLKKIYEWLIGNDKQNPPFSGGAAS